MDIEYEEFASRKSNYWAGFLRSLHPVDTQRRYKAKCKKCKGTFTTSKANFVSHRERCTWDEEDAKIYGEDPPPPPLKREREEVVEEDGETTTDEMIYMEYDSELPLNNIIDQEFVEPGDKVRCPENWVGFLRSTLPADKQRRHKAKCITCAAEIIATTASMDVHRRRCPTVSQMPKQKRRIIARAPEEEGVPNGEEAIAEDTQYSHVYDDEEAPQEEGVLPQIDPGVFQARILRRMKRINVEHAELRSHMAMETAQLQNEMLEQQLETQKLMKKLLKMEKEVAELKKAATRESVIRDNLPDFPLFRMEQVDEVEERISTDASFKDRLGSLFAAAHAEKVGSILRWFSPETLIQFTPNPDHGNYRYTGYSEIFQLMFCVWTSESFRKNHFSSTITSALEIAQSKLFTANQARNSRNRNSVEDGFCSE